MMSVVTRQIAEAFESTDRVAQAASAKSRKRLTPEQTPTMDRVAKARELGFFTDIHDPLVKTLHQRDLRKASEGSKKSHITGEPENKSYISRIKQAVRDLGKDPSTYFKSLEKKEKPEKEPKAKGEKSIASAISNAYIKLDLPEPENDDILDSNNDKAYEANKARFDKLMKSSNTHSPEQFKLGSNPILQGLARKAILHKLTKDNDQKTIGQKFIMKVLDNLSSTKKSRSPRSREIKVSKDYFQSPIPESPGPHGFKVIGNEKPSLDKGVSNDMLSRMKKNALFRRSMEGQTKIVVDKKKNPFIDPSAAAKQARKGGGSEAWHGGRDLKSISTREAKKYE